MAGEFYDEEGNSLYYKDQVDNYKQDHYQLHWNQNYIGGWASNFGLHYTYGRGFYENYNVGYDSPDYIDRRWLDNDFYGFIFSLSRRTKKYNSIIGGSYNKYSGEHYGEYLWIDQDSNSINSYDFKEKFYDDYGNKNEFNIYAKIDYYINDKLSIYGDLQYRIIKYDAGISANSVFTGYVEEGFSRLDKIFNFFNPKFGLFYNLNDSNNIYFSYARAQREPTRTDYANGSPDAEKLNDFELGWKLTLENSSINVNAFYMIYENQLVLTGQRDINGYEIRRNIGESFRLGIELDSNITLSSKLNLNTNLSISSNKNQDFYSIFDGILKNYGNTDLAYSPSLIANNIIDYSPNDKVIISLRSNYVSEQYFAQTNSPISKLDSFFVHDLNFIHKMSIEGLSDDINLKILVNNLFNSKYVSYGGYYTYNVPIDNQIKTYEGTYYFPQAEINILIGLDFKF